MVRRLSDLAVRIFLASLVIILINVAGTRFNYYLPINLFNISVIAGFGIPGIIAVVILNHMIG